MSACISRHGEFSSHTLDALHTCTLCGVLDEDALRAELTRVTAERDQARAALATVRTGKSRVGDGVDRRDWTRQQWLDDAREAFNGPVGSAGDLLNGHVSAMWAELATVTGERDEAVQLLADTVVKATEHGVQDRNVANYILPTGPIHRAIPWLEQRGITVRPGFDGRTEAVSNGG